MAEVRSAGVSVSAAQLERWRAKGLLPRASRTWRGRYGSESELPAGSLELATALGRRARRGQDWSELAIQIWLDGAPVREALLSRALRKVAVQLAELGRQTVEKAMARHPVPDEWSLGLEYDQAEALTQMFMRTMGTSPVNRQMRARLRAAGYQEIPEFPLEGVLTHLITQEPADEELVQQWVVAIGLDSAGDATPSEDAQRAAAGMCFGTGLRELIGLGLGEALERAGQEFFTSDSVVSLSEMEAARQDLVWCLDLMLIGPEERPGASGQAATLIGFLCLLWALVRRMMPVGADVRDMVKLGARLLQNDELLQDRPSLPGPRQPAAALAA